MNTEKPKAKLRVSLLIGILFVTLLILEACSPPCYRRFDCVDHKFQKLNAKIDSLSTKVDSLQTKK